VSRIYFKWQRYNSVTKTAAYLFINTEANEIATSSLPSSGAITPSSTIFRSLVPSLNMRAFARVLFLCRVCRTHKTFSRSSSWFSPLPGVHRLEMQWLLWVAEMSTVGVIIDNLFVPCTLLQQWRNQMVLFKSCRVPHALRFRVHVVHVDCLALYLPYFFRLSPVCRWEDWREGVLVSFRTFAFAWKTNSS